MQVFAVAPTGLAVAEEDALRAHVYGMLEHLLASPPDAAMLAMLVRLQGDDETPLGRALATLREAALATSPQAAAAEFGVLFVGLTEGELRPYASWYLTGFLHGRPLALVRATMQVLGVARAEGNCEPEDHIASVCAIMAGLILGRFGPPADLATQQAYLAAHLRPWVGHFFDDLAHAEAAPFYQAVGRVGAAFMRIEESMLGSAGSV